MKEMELNCALKFGEFIDPENANEIIDSQTFNEGKWERETNLEGFQDGVKKTIIPVDMSFYKLSVLTTVAPNTSVRKHSHAEPIIRFIISGSLNLNGKIYKAGDWVLVPTKCPYEISTKEGYVTIAGYGQACDSGDDE